MVLSNIEMSEFLEKQYMAVKPNLCESAKQPFANFTFGFLRIFGWAGKQLKTIHFGNDFMKRT